VFRQRFKSKTIERADLHRKKVLEIIWSGTMKKLLKSVLVIALLAPWASAFADHIVPEGSDATWVTTGDTISFEVLYISGSINANGNLAFGADFPSSGGSFQEQIFTGGIISLGDSRTYSSSAGVTFGLWLANIGNSLCGPYTLYSDSSLNASICERSAGLDAMIATFVSANTYDIEFEDLFLPINGEGSGDIIVRMTGATYVPVSEPGTLLLLGAGLLGFGIRKAKAAR
jgi:hypothetical protein